MKILVVGGGGREHAIAQSVRRGGGELYSVMKNRNPGIVKFNNLHTAKKKDGSLIVMNRNGELVIADENGRERERYGVVYGAKLNVKEGQKIDAGVMLSEWDPFAMPIVAEVGGTIKFEDVIEGETMRMEKDPSGHVRQLIMEHKGDLHPQIVLEDESGKILDFYYLPEKANIEVTEGKMVSAGTLLAKTPREVSGTQDITGGLPRVTEIFEARKPKDPAVIAEIDGTVEILGEKRTSVTEVASKVPSAGAITYSRGVIRILDRAALMRMSTEYYDTLLEQSAMQA